MKPSPLSLQKTAYCVFIRAPSWPHIEGNFSGSTVCPQRGRAAARSPDRYSSQTALHRLDYHSSVRGLDLLGRHPFRSLDRLQSVLFHLVVACEPPFIYLV